MTSKIHIKVGNLEIDFEGSEDFIKQDLLKTFEQITDIFDMKDFQIPDTQETGKTGEKLGGKSQGKSDIKGTTNSIAAKLGVKSGRDIVLAACAHLHFVKQSNTFDRTKILQSMKLATSYYKESHRSNLVNNLNTLIRQQKLNEISKGTYALPAKMIKELEGRLA
jgi:hypothetical protein